MPVGLRFSAHGNVLIQYNGSFGNSQLFSEHRISRFPSGLTNDSLHEEWWCGANLHRRKMTTLYQTTSNCEWNALYSQNAFIPKLILKYIPTHLKYTDWLKA